MPEIRGSWTLDAAIVHRWDDADLDEVFRAFWPVTTETRYGTLHDDEARPTPPGPYCVYELAEGSIDERSSGKFGDTENHLIRIPLEFRIHAKSTASRSGKSIVQELAKKVAESYDAGNTFGPLAIDPDSHFTTMRESDFSVRLGDTEWSWVLQYDVILDAEYDSPRTV